MGGHALLSTPIFEELTPPKLVNRGPVGSKSGRRFPFCVWEGNRTIVV